MRCANCGGQGRVPDSFGGPRWVVDCEDCVGSGAARCDGCGRRATVADENNYTWCRQCAPKDEDYE